MAVALLLALAAPAAASGPPANIRVNQDVDDPIRAHFNSSIAVDPSDPARLVVTDSEQGSPSRCFVHRSVDAGETWRSDVLPLPGGFTACSAGTLHFGGDGRLYFAAVLSSATVPSSVAVWRSDDGGETLDGPAFVALGSPPPDPTGTLGAGRVTNSSPFLAGHPLEAGTVLATFVRCVSTQTTATPVTVPVQTAFCRPFFSASQDAGESWSEPVAIGDLVHYGQSASAAFTTIGVGREGVIHAAFADRKTETGLATDGSLILASSRDGGRSFTTSVIDAAADYPSRPRLAADPTSDHVYVVWEDERRNDVVSRGTLHLLAAVAPALGAVRRDVLFRRSTDGGATWDPARTLNTDADGASTDHFRPVLSIAPNGRLDAWWYDGRFGPRDKSDPAYNRLYDVAHTWSEDGGSTFAPEMRVTGTSSDVRVGPGGQAWTFTHVMASTREAVYLVWTDTRDGDQGFFGVNDTYFARVAHE